jgi:hypothetical protein
MDGSAFLKIIEPSNHAILKLYIGLKFGKVLLRCELHVREKVPIAQHGVTDRTDLEMRTGCSMGKREVRR